MRNILTTLRAEHATLRELLDQLNATTDRAGKRRAELLHRIEALLIPHAKWEELVFYPAYAERASHDELLQHAEAIQEHRAIEQTVLPDLHASPATTRQFAGSARVLAEFVHLHSREEERAMFRAARELFTRQELAELDEQYAAWKESVGATAITAHAKVKTALKSALRFPRAPG